MGNCVGGKGKKDPTVLSEDEIKLLLENTKLNRAQINALHQNFLKECPSGKLTKKDFVKLFKEVHPSENKKEKADKFCEYVFKVIDTQGLGYISFNDFVLCFSLTSYGDFKQKCEFAFRLYDLDKDNLISKKEMTQVLEALYDLSGIVDRKKDKSPAKKVEEIMKKINAKTEADAKAAAEAAKSAEPAAPATEAPAEPATPGKKDAKKAPKDPKPKTEKKPAPAKPVKARDFINKDQFIDACSNDEALKKLFVDSIFNSNADSSAAAAPAAAAASVSICAPTININSPPLDAPAVVEITHSSHVEVRSAPVDASVSEAVAALSAAVAEAAEPVVAVQVAAEPAAAPAVEAIAEPIVIECRLETATLEAPVVDVPVLEVSLGAPEPAATAEVVAPKCPEPVAAPEVAAAPEVVLECSASPAVVEVTALSAPDLPAVEVEVKPVEQVHAVSESEGTTTVIASETHTTTVNGVTTTEKVVTVTSSSSSSADASSVVEQINSVIDSLNNADIKVELKN